MNILFYNKVQTFNRHALINAVQFQFAEYHYKYDKLNQSL